MILLDGAKLAVLIPARLGDALFCTPAISLLKQQRPNASITIIAASTLGGSVFNKNPAVTLVLLREKGADFVQQLQNFDCIISPHYDAPTIQALAEQPITHLSVGPPDTHHQSQQATAFIASLLELDTVVEPEKYQLYPGPAEQDRINKILSDAHVLPEDLLIGCHVGCHGLAKGKGFLPWTSMQHRKVWPLSQFIAFAKVMRQRFPHARFVLTGSKEEQILAQTFLKHFPTTINLMDQTTVLETAELISRLRLFVVGDTGALHLACATSVPLLALFGPTELSRTGPYPKSSHHIVIQHNPLNKLSPEVVVGAAVRLLG